MTRVNLLCLTFLVSLASCGTPRVSLTTGPRAITPEDYDDYYDKWTRERTTYDWVGLDDVLRLTATFESWEFRWAYVVRYSHDHSLPGADQERLLRASLNDAQEYHRFFVTVSGRIFDEQELASDSSAWRVILLDSNGRQTEPLAIEKVRRPTAAERVYFPSISPQRLAFRIVFPAVREDGTSTIGEGDSEVRLRFAGARGRVDAIWELER